MLLVARKTVRQTDRQLDGRTLDWLCSSLFELLKEKNIPILSMGRSKSVHKTTYKCTLIAAFNVLLEC